MTQRLLVIGAGISGLATAVALQRRRHRVTILEERADTPSGAAITIWPNALAALDEIGLGDAVRAAGGRVAGGAVRWSNGSWLRHPTPERTVEALGEPLVVIGEAATRARSGDPKVIAATIAAPGFEIAAFKGVPVSIRPWDRQLRQPILLVQPKMLVSLAPEPGFLHPDTPLDSLGFDQGDTTCKLPTGGKS